MDSLANIILVISKADTLTLSELKAFKKKVKTQVRENEINIFNFERNSFNDADVGMELENKHPFTIISFDSSKKDVNNRVYPWGSPGTMNVDHCDFKILDTRCKIMSSLERLVYL